MDCSCSVEWIEKTTPAECINAQNTYGRVHLHDTQALEMLLRRMSVLRGPLNRATSNRRSSSKGLHLVETTSVQLARYPGDGHGYVRHRDTPKSAQDSDEIDRKVQ